MNSLATQLLDSLYDENGLVTVLGEIRAIYAEEGLATKGENVLSSDRDEVFSREVVAEEATISAEGINSDGGGGRKRKTEEDNEEEESVGNDIRENGTIDVDEVSQTSTPSEVICKTQRTNVEMLLAHDTRETSLLQIRSQHVGGADIRKAKALRKKQTHSGVRKKGAIDIDEISQTSTPSEAMGKTQRTNVEMLLDTSGDTSLLQMKSQHIDGTNAENIKAVRAKLAANRLIDKASQDASSIRIEPTFADMIMNGGSFDFVDLSHLPSQDATRFARNVNASVGILACQNNCEFIRRALTATGSIRPEKRDESESRGTTYIPDLLRSAFTSKSISEALDRLSYSVTRQSSSKFLEQMEININESIREFNAHHKDIIEITGREARSKSSSSASSERCEGDSTYESEPLTSELIKDVLTQEIAIASEEITTRVNCHSSERQQAHRSWRPRRARNSQGPVDVDEVSLTTTQTERALRRREKEYRMKSSMLRKAANLKALCS